MPLNKEKMRIYMANRRARQRERGGIEGVKRAKDIESEMKDVHLDAVGIALQQGSGPIAGKTEHSEPILPVPVLAEPDAAELTQSSGEARESTDTKLKRSVEQVASEPRGGQESMTNTIEAQHTKTDLLFENKKPGYYIFEREVQRDKDLRLKKCWYCGEEYETRMKLNKFCCPDHKERWLIQSFRMGKE